MNIETALLELTLKGYTCKESNSTRFGWPVWYVSMHSRSQGLFYLLSVDGEAMWARHAFVYDKRHDALFPIKLPPQIVLAE